MIEINLLPEELRKKRSPFAGIDLSALNLQRLPVIPIVAGFVGVLIVVELGVLAIGAYYSIRLGSLTKSYDAILPQRSEADELRARKDAMAKKMGAIDELMGRRFSWARKLNALSDAITPGIWLSELDYAEQPAAQPQPVKGKGSEMPGMLILNGYAAGAGEQGAALVGKFITSLKDNGQFFSDFGDIVLVSIKSDKVDNQEVMSFKINCIFK